MKHLSFFLLLSLFAVPAYLPAQAGAQFTIPGAESSISIELRPAHPAPGSSVELTLQSPLYDLEGSDITWSANGKTIGSGPGAVSATVTVGALGSQTDVTVLVDGDRGLFSSEISIIPTSMDLLWESDSFTPPFYKGRALPSAGSGVTLVAIPHFFRQGGAEVPADQVVYTWKKDGEILGSLSGRGKSSARIRGSLLFGNDVISVEATSLDGAFSGEASARIKDVEPDLILYEDHPLFGVLYHRALIGTTFIPETEMSFTASPYFAAITNADDSNLEYAWRVNEADVVPNPLKPSEITINAEKSSGIARVELSLAHATNYFLDVRGRWGITFTKNGASTGIGDVFHQ